MVRFSTLAPALALFGLSATARAADPFEIQVYDGSANAPGEFGLELHLNHWITGHRTTAPPELPLHRQTHATLEPSLGLFPFWEIGAYLQSALRADGTPDYAGAKLRSKFVLPRPKDDPWRFGLNIEVSLLPERYDADRWGSELRPIVAYDDQRWLFALNPIVSQPFGKSAGDGPSFEPSFKAARSLGAFALGFEYYSDLGPIASPLPLREQEHYLYGAFDLLSVEKLELNAALGAGLTPESAGLTAKVIVGYSFDRL
jgi:hypothetical protein